MSPGQAIKSVAVRILLASLPNSNSRIFADQDFRAFLERERGERMKETENIYAYIDKILFPDIYLQIFHINAVESILKIGK